MEQRKPPAPDPRALNHAAQVWGEDHRLEEATLPQELKGPDDVGRLGHMRLTVDLLFSAPLAPQEEKLMRVIAAVSDQLTDLHDSLREEPEGEPLGLRAQFVRYDGPVE